MYVNVPNLVEHLSGLDPDRDHYLGKLYPHGRSWYTVKRRVGNLGKIGNGRYGPVFYATGDVICLSRSAAEKIVGFRKTAAMVTKMLGVSDDLALAYIAHAVGINMTQVDKIHTHYEFRGGGDISDRTHRQIIDTICLLSYCHMSKFLTNLCMLWVLPKYAPQALEAVRPRGSEKAGESICQRGLHCSLSNALSF